MDGELGAQGLWTETNIDLRTSDCRVLCPDVSATDLEDTVFAYGFGAGLTWRPSERGVFGLDVGARYSRGGEAKYLTENAIIRNTDGQPTVNVSRSRTDMLLFYFALPLADRALPTFPPLLGITRRRRPRLAVEEGEPPISLVENVPADVARARAEGTFGHGLIILARIRIFSSIDQSRLRRCAGITGSTVDKTPNQKRNLFAKSVKRSVPAGAN